MGTAAAAAYADSVSRRTPAVDLEEGISTEKKEIHRLYANCHNIHINLLVVAAAAVLLLWLACPALVPP